MVSLRSKQLAPVFGCLVLLMAPGWSQIPAKTEPKKPNIIFILADDLGYGDLEISGNPYVKTPNLDKLARHSILCTKAYAAYPICLPSRVSILSGRYAERTGARMNINNHAAELDQPWLPLLLKNAGYATCALGKWGLGDVFPTALRPTGFETWAITHPGGGEDRWDYKIHRPDGVTELSKHRYVTDLLNDEAIKFIEQNSKRPFFIYLAEPAPHWPLEAPDEDVAPFKNRQGINNGAAILYGMVQHLDRKIGELIIYLKKKDLFDNTIIVFTSDNGPDFGTWFNLKLERWNDSLTGHKGEVWEGGIKVPAFISWPAMFGDHPKPFRDIVDGVDWQPTLCAAAGITNSAAPVDGTNLLPRFLGQSTEPTPPRYWNFNIVRPVVESNGAYRVGDWKIVRPPIEDFNMWGKPIPGAPAKKYDPKNPERIDFVFQPADLPLPAKLPEYQLFNLAEDPDEKHDLAAAQPERLQQMIKAYEQTYREVEGGPDNAKAKADPTPKRKGPMTGQ